MPPIPLSAPALCFSRRHELLTPAGEGEGLVCTPAQALVRMGLLCSRSRFLWCFQQQNRGSWRRRQAEPARALHSHRGSTFK